MFVCLFSLGGGLCLLHSLQLTSPEEGVAQWCPVHPGERQETLPSRVCSASTLRARGASDTTPAPAGADRSPPPGVHTPVVWGSSQRLVAPPSGAPRYADRDLAPGSGLGWRPRFCPFPGPRAPSLLSHVQGLHEPTTSSSSPPAVPPAAWSVVPEPRSPVCVPAIKRQRAALTVLEPSASK